MVVERSVFQVGGTVLPLAASSNSLLQDGDPALFGMLSFLQSILTTYAQARWSSELSSLALPDGYLVSTIIPYDPVPSLTEAQFTFPLLALYRTKASFEEHTINTYRINDRWALDFILPPLTVGQLEHLHPILTVVERIILDRCMLGFDPFYQGGSYAFPTIDWLRLVEREILTLERRPFNATSPTFRLLHLVFEVKEKQIDNLTSFEPFAGLDASVNPSILNSDTGPPNPEAIAMLAINPT